MIKGFTSQGPYIFAGSATHPYFNTSTPSAGMMRYNGNYANVEVYDGSYWQTISCYQEVNLTPEANKILDWAKEKMQEEQRREKLANSNLAVAAALENLKRAEEQLQTTIHLSIEHETTTS